MVLQPWTAHTHPYIYINICVYMWESRGLMVRESDSLSKGCGFESRSGRDCRWGEWMSSALSTFNTTMRCSCVCEHCSGCVFTVVCVLTAVCVHTAPGVFTGCVLTAVCVCTAPGLCSQCVCTAPGVCSQCVCVCVCVCVCALLQVCVHGVCVFTAVCVHLNAEH